MAGSWRKVAWTFVVVLCWGGAALATGPSTVKGGDAEHVTDELIVKYRPGNKELREEIHRRHGSRKLKEFPAYAMERVKVRPGSTLADAQREFESDPAVEYAEPNYRLRAFSVPGDPSWSRLWGMAKINAPAAWDTSTGSGDMVVAVIDSGIDYNHPDLKGNLWVNAAELNGKAGVDDDGNGVRDDLYGYNAITGSGDPFDSDGHGTHVAGTIGAVGNNGVGVAGVNWNVRIMACKFLDDDESGTTADVIDCLHYVAEMKRRGVNIVATNNSWGGDSYSRALYEAINAQRDILFIAAAGNDHTNNDTTPSYPANYDLPNIVAVAATTSTDSLASFSQYGRRTVHVGAPGSSIYSTWPGNGYATLSGTSMATPHVTGLAALIKAARPTADWRGVRNLLLAGGKPVSSLADKTVSGRRIDAFGSLTCLDSRVFSALHFPAPVQAGVPATLSALSINCDAPLGPVTAALSGGEVIELKDDGVYPDLAAGDGVFTAAFTPARPVETFFFSSPAGMEQIGSTPFDTVITASPSSFANSSTATFAFTATVAGATFACAIDGGSFTSCTSPYTTPTLADGSHSFSVRATDSSGATDPSPASRSWSIDTVPPLLTLNGVTTPTKVTYQVISGTVEGGVTPMVSIPTATAAPVIVSGNSWNCTITGLAAGDNVITVQAVDTAGNVTTRQGTVRVTIPDGSFGVFAAVDLADAVKALKVAVGIINPTAEELVHLDVAPLVNGIPAPDGRIDIADAVVILKRTVGLLSF